MFEPLSVVMASAICFIKTSFIGQLLAQNLLSSLHYVSQSEQIFEICFYFKCCIAIGLHMG